MADLRYEDVKRAVQEILGQESLGILRDLRYGHGEIRRQTQHIENMRSQLQEMYSKIQAIQQQAGNLDNTARNSNMALQAIQHLQQVVIELQRGLIALEQNTQNINRMATDYQQRHAT